MNMFEATATDLPVIHVQNRETMIAEDAIKGPTTLCTLNKGPLLQASALKRQQLKHVFQSKSKLTRHLDQACEMEQRATGKALNLKFERTARHFKRHSVATRNLPKLGDHGLTDYHHTRSSQDYLAGVPFRQNSTSRMRLDETRFKQTSRPFRHTSTLVSNASSFKGDPNQDLSSMLKTLREEVSMLPSTQTRQPSTSPLEIVAPSISKDTLREAESCANEFRIGLGIAASQSPSVTQLNFTRSSAILAGLQTDEAKWLEVEDLREELAFKKKVYAQNKFTMLKNLGKMMQKVRETQQNSVGGQKDEVLIRQHRKDSPEDLSENKKDYKSSDVTPGAS